MARKYEILTSFYSISNCQNFFFNFFIFKMQQSATTSKPLMCEVNNNDPLFTIQWRSWHWGTPTHPPKHCCRPNNPSSFNVMAIWLSVLKRYLKPYSTQAMSKNLDFLLLLSQLYELYLCKCVLSLFWFVFIFTLCSSRWCIMTTRLCRLHRLPLRLTVFLNLVGLCEFRLLFVSARAHYTTVRGHHRTEITPHPTSVLSQPNSLCLLSFSITCFPISHAHTTAHSANQRSEKGHLCLPGLPGDKEEAVIRGIDPVGTSLADHYPATGVSTAAVAAVMLQKNNDI